MSHHTTEHVLRSWFLTNRFSTRNCIVLLIVLRAIFPCSPFPIRKLHYATEYVFAQFFPCPSFPIRKLHHATEQVLPKFSPAPRFSNWCRIILLSMFCGVDFWSIIFQLEIASCCLACWAQFLPCSSFFLMNLHYANEHVLLIFSRAPPFPNWCRISRYWACFAEFSFDRWFVN